IHNMLKNSDLSFRDFMEVALYHPQFGYYMQPASPAGKEGDYVTSPALSPVFSFALSLVVSEFVRFGTDEVCSIVDIGCGDGSLEWEPMYEDICRFVTRGLIVTFDYGFPENQLFSGRLRHFGTAAAYAGHRVSRDLLANPGRQDLTAHINFTDLKRAGERNGFTTLFFDRQAKFLLAASATEHELFKPIDEVQSDDLIALREQREDAR